MMASYVPLNKVDDDACFLCCCKQQYASTWSSRVTRNCLLTVLVVCLLAVALLLARWVLSSRSQTFPNNDRYYLSWNCCSEQDKLHNTSAAKICSVSEDGTSHKCHVKKQQIVAVNSSQQNSVMKVDAGFSPPCPETAVAQLTENVYSNDDLPVRRLPQVLIIGVRKGGTRALLEFLNLHPDVQAERREMHFFDNDNHFRRGFEWYRRQMHATHEGQITVEKTPAYFVEDEVAARVYKMNSSIRMLVTLRDPVERAISDYLQIQEQREAKGRSRLSFEHLVIDSETGDIDDSYQAVRRSMYDVHLTRWLRYFSVDQFHFLCAENLVASPAEELRKVETFLGLRHVLTKDLFYFNKSRGFYCMCVDQRKRESNPDRQVVVDGKCLSSSKGRTHPSVDPQVLNKLREFFRPHNERLYKLVGVDFGWK